MTVPKEFETPEGLRTLANFLRSQHGVKVKSGIEHEKRVDYFKGKKLVEVILDANNKKWPRSLPRITEAAVAVEVAELLLRAQFFHRSEKYGEKKGYLKISQVNVFEEKGYYTWMYAGNMMWSNIATGLVIALVIGFTLLPIWPDAAKKILWYMSVTFLIFTLSFCLVRLLLFLFLWVFGYDFWIFPRLFDESLSFQDSFKPVYTFETVGAGQGYYRIATLAALVGFVYWAYTQPTEFDGFLQAQKEFVDDLYSGKLLSDVAFDPKEHMAKQGKKVPSLEDLLKELERDEMSISDKATEGAEQGEGAEESVEQTSGGASSEYIPPTHEEMEAADLDLDREVEEEAETETGKEEEE